MTSACGCSHDAPETTEFSEPEAPPTPWWRDREVLVPVFSGIALAAAFLNAAFGICLGCQIYPLVARLRRAPSPA